MSRRKQSKPQQHLGVTGGELNNKFAGISVPLEDQATTCPEELSSDGIDDRMHLDQKADGSDSPMPPSEVHICTNCRRELIGTTQFLEHREKCMQKQVVLIMNDQKEDTKEVREEPVHGNEDGGSDIMDTNDENSEEGVSPEPPTSLLPPVNHMEDSREDEKLSKEQQRPIDFSAAQTVDQNEETRPEDGLLETEEVPVITTSVGRWGISATNSSNSSSWSLPATTSRNSTSTPKVLCDITSHSNLGEKLNGIVKSIPSSVAVIQEQLHTLHQQHLQQMQIIIQIQEKIKALVDESLERGIDVSSKENAEEPSIIKPRALPVETSMMHLTPSSHPNAPSTIQILQKQVRQTPSLPFPAFPLSSPHSPFDLFQPSHPGIGAISNLLEVPAPLPYPGSLHSHRKGKSPNVSVFDPKFTDDAFFRHKCHFCHKVFGSDSALQIHIRSHTGERPFRCNICGNRFSTKGNLKVHFQRHQAQYPDVEMDITPYPPSPVPHDQQPLQPPSIDHIPMLSLPSESTRPLSEDSSYQQELLSSQSERDMSEINNNDELSETQKLDVEEKQIDTKIGTTSGDEAVEIGRPSSAPSTVITSNMSPTDTYMQDASSGAALNERAEKDPNAATSVNSTTVDENPMRSSDTLKLQHLVESIEKKITEPNECVICHKVLSCKNALQLHYRIHTGERPFKCNICGRTFTTKGNLKTHYSVHKTKPAYPLYHECPICHKNFINPILLQQHLKLHAAEDLMMHSTLGQEGYFKEKSDMQRKPENLMESFQARFNYMEVPWNGDSRKPDLTRHFEEREEISGKRQKLSDSELDGIASTQMEKDRYLQYPMDHSEKLTDEGRVHSENGLSLLSSNSEEPELIMNEASGNSDGALDLTPKTTSSSPDSVRSDPLPLTSSAQDNQKPRSESSRPASDSEKAFSDNNIELKPYTNGEMRQIFDSNIPSFLMGRHRNPSNTTCYFCGKTFACASALNIHYRSHTKERPFKCDVCCKGFSTRGNLKQHMLTHKIRDMPTQLLRMDMTTTNSGTNITTVKTESSSAGNEAQTPKRAEEITDSTRPISSRHQCSVCDKQFQSDSALQIHVRTHTGEKPYKCHICGRAFTTKGNMKVHMGTHMWNGESRRGRRITMDPPHLMNHKENTIYRNDLFGSFRPSLDYPFFQYPPPHSLLNGFPPLGKPNEISVIQDPHNMSLHFRPSSESSHPKNGSADSLSSGYPRSNSSGGSGHSSPDKKSYSPSAEVEHLPLPAFPPSTHSPAALNYLNLVRLSRMAAVDSAERMSPLEMPSYLVPDVSSPGTLSSLPTKVSLPTSTSMRQQSPRPSIQLLSQSDVRTSNVGRPMSGYLTAKMDARTQSPLAQVEREARLRSPLRRSEGEARMQSPAAHENTKRSAPDENMRVHGEDPLTNPSRMVEQSV